MSEKYIDVEKVLKEKVPKFYKVIPRFLVSWVKKVLHEEDINYAMSSFGHLRDLKFNDSVLKFLDAKVISHGVDNIPESGSVIIASNHPLGGLDGMALIKAVSEKRKDIKFIVNDVLLKLENYSGIFVGVNKLGSTPKSSLLEVEKVFASDNAILFFPAGLVSRKQKINGKWQIQDLMWNKTFVQKAVQYSKPIIPTFIEGKNSNFFYNLAYWRKKLGIKGNIEMLFLPDEMFKQKHQTIPIYFGKPIRPEILDKSKNFNEWANVIKNYVYSGSIQKNISFEEYLKK
ncbi:MAG: glycerol acyltransferase [Bacteroidia bacterium]|nr:MAG: glycerol acyltransferase [Bacteroidia bacterium]